MNFNNGILFDILQAIPCPKDSSPVDCRLLFDNINVYKDFQIILFPEYEYTGKEITQIKLNTNKKSILSKCKFNFDKKQCELFSLTNYQINGDVVFEANRELPCLDFSNTKFNGELFLENKTFSSKTDFSGCTFKKAPKFYNSTLHPDTNFPQKNAFKDRRSIAHNAYETLYSQMAILKKREYEGTFYALSQACQRKILFERKLFENPVGYAPSKLEWFFSLLYGLLSDYGRNYIRTLVLIIPFLFFYPFVYKFINHDITYSEALLFSFQQALPFPILHDDGITTQKICEYSPKLATLPQTDGACKKNLNPLTPQVTCNIIQNDLNPKNKSSNINSDTHIPFLSIKNKLHLDSFNVQKPIADQKKEQRNCAINIKILASIQTLILTVLFAIFILALRWNFKRD